jgi:hypothetical protein
MTDTSPTIDAIDRVAIIGAGTIGASWAALFLARGLSVEVFDPAPDAERTVRDYVTTAWPSLERLGLADRGDPARLGFHGDAASAAKGVQLVQENVPERVDIKHATYRLIEPVLPADAIIATSTSGILLILTPLIFDRFCPFDRTKGFDSPDLVGDALPSSADGVDDGVVVRPQAMREEAFFEVEPETLDGVELG